ncbi:MFS transporter [Picrophilus oshimae]|uniref:Sugar transport protein n=1 Tax=Picrophilus torridus (strain ATCC 700027 / DSM 9790 / JCM 10055 / NBRC 100828 / KAW 2/3) TaxID=1122961 RepID=Q6L286_PICTO|nr:MFS transporter [Picrophilus oshimae]AAT42916.1 sugar transport protein [Picrophilus oshimae DSM 9789]
MFENRRIDSIPVSPMLLKITALSSMGVFMDGYILTIYSIAYIYMSGYLNPSSNAVITAFMGSSLFIGMLLGGFSMGHLADTLGRKRLYEYDLSLTAVFLILTALSFNVYEFIIFEILAGIGIGADYPISSSIQAEFSPRNTRGRFLIFNIFAWTIGSIVFLLLSIPIIHYTGAYQWRFMYGTAAIIPLIVILSRRTLPESPFWLSHMNMKDKALEVSNRVSSSIGIELNEIPKTESGRSSFRDLFSNRYLKYTVFVSLAWFSYDIASYGVWEYTPSVFFTGSSSIVASVFATILEEIPVFAGFLICIYFIERAGRRDLELIGFGGAAISLFIFEMIYGYVRIDIVFTFLAFATMHLFHNLGPTNITYDYPVEIFPTRIRSTAMGFATSISRIGAILGTIAFPLILYTLNLRYVLIFLIIFELIGFTITFLVAPETKNMELN